MKMDAKCDRSPIPEYPVKQKIGETRKIIKRMFQSYPSSSQIERAKSTHQAAGTNSCFPFSKGAGVYFAGDRVKSSNSARKGVVDRKKIGQ